jgi:hypothetical protein
MNPRMMKSGREGCVRAVEVPRMMGRSGRMQGPAIVTIPARKEKKNRVIMCGQYGISASGLSRHV